MAVTATEPNLYQLGQEIGGNPAWRMLGPDDDGNYTVTAAGLEDALVQAALDAHDPDPSVVPPPSAADLEVAAKVTKIQNVNNALTTLRQWANDAHTVGAQGANVTQAQHKALFDRMGTFLDRFADYIEGQRS